jgi:hypothetical protein
MERKYYGEEIEFSDGFTELHTNSYRKILDGKGFHLEEARKSIETVYEIRNSWFVRRVYPILKRDYIKRFSLRILFEISPLPTSKSTQHFHPLEGRPSDEWFVTSDPEGIALGSGGGTAHLLSECWKQEQSGGEF